MRSWRGYSSWPESASSVANECHRTCLRAPLKDTRRHTSCSLTCKVGGSVYPCCIHPRKMGNPNRSTIGGGLQRRSLSGAAPPARHQGRRRDVPALLRRIALRHDPPIFLHTAIHDGCGAESGIRSDACCLLQLLAAQGKCLLCVDLVITPSDLVDKLLVERASISIFAPNGDKPTGVVDVSKLPIAGSLVRFVWNQSGQLLR
jgi:hypothetical protein